MPRYHARLLKHRAAIAAGLLCVLLSGCTHFMAFSRRTQSLNLDKQSIVLMVVETTRWNKSQFGLGPEHVVLAHTDAQGNEETAKYLIDPGSQQWIPSLKDYLYFIRVAVRPGQYELRYIQGNAGAGWYMNAFKIPILARFDVPPHSIIYLGRIRAELRPRSAGDFHVDAPGDYPSPPIFNSLIGVGCGTFDVSISDASAKDIPLMRNLFPALRTVDIQTDILPPFDRARIDAWWRKEHPGSASRGADGCPQKAAVKGADTSSTKTH